MFGCSHNISYLPPGLFSDAEFYYNLNAFIINLNLMYWWTEDESYQVMPNSGDCTEYCKKFEKQVHFE